MFQFDSSRKFVPEHSDGSARSSVFALPGTSCPRARVVHFGDSVAEAKLTWLQLVGLPFDRRKISEAYVTDLGSSGDPFDILLVSGGDQVRIRRFLRINKPLLNGKLKIALMPSSKPRDRALLLSAGFDDVFDLKMNTLEARMRACTMSERMGASTPMRVRDVA